MAFLADPVNLSEFEASIAEDIDSFITGDVALFYKQIIDTVRDKVDNVDEEVTKQATESLYKVRGVSITPYSHRPSGRSDDSTDKSL